MTREQLSAQLAQEYALRREENLRRYRQNEAAACARCPGLRALLDARHAAVLGGIRSALLTVRKDERANEALPNQLDGCNRRIADALAKAGLPADALAPVYACPLCKDEGVVYDPMRRPCDCFEKELTRRLLAQSGGAAGEEQTFECFRDEVFAAEVDAPVSQRTAMRRNRDVCEAYADAFPDGEIPNLILIGKSGLGKTFLMHCIAHRVAERGHEAVYQTAYRLLDGLRKAYFGGSGAEAGSFLHAELLLIDDLGTEPLWENVTVTQIFSLLNERQSAGLHTVISTNLEISELKTRYTERVASRLLDPSQWKRLTFIGDDVRPGLAKRKQEGDA